MSESDGSATVKVTKSGLSRGDVLCTLIPLSLDEARVQFGYDRTGSFDDPAEIGKLASHVKIWMTMYSQQQPFPLYTFKWLAGTLHP